MSKQHLLYLDIETLPAPDDLRPVIEALYQKQANRNMTFEDYWRGTALNGNFGQILCIGYALDDAPAEVLTASEPEQLKAFWQITNQADKLVGHAIINFDLPFIIKRSIIHQIPINPRFAITRDQAPNVFDTKQLWDIGAGPAISLDTFAKIFHLPTSKTDIDGAQVYDAWVKGKQKQIYDYCRRDVELTRKIFLRLQNYV